MAAKRSPKSKPANRKRNGFSDVPNFGYLTGEEPLYGDAERAVTAGTPQDGRLKKASEVTAEVVTLALRQRFNPLRGLTPELLSMYLDQFILGYVAYCGLVWDQIEKRDDVIRNVASKRKNAVAKLKRESFRADDSAEAEEHAKALDYFYDNLTAVNALDQNEVGGVSLLVRQMMDAVGKYYAVHEIVWKDGADGLTAELRFVPLWFFENRSGRLQFLQIPLGGVDGVPLDPGGWMITKGDGIMEACSIAYMYKNMSLKDWVSYSNKFGTPGVLGRTNAAQGSPGGQAMNAAVQNFGQDWAATIYGDDGIIKDPIQLVQVKGEGVLPFPILTERMDRAITSLWRGGDLSTMSADRKGASIQGDESEILLDADASTISETLNMYIDRWIIWNKFHTSPKALSRIVVPKTVNIDKDLAVLKLLLEARGQIGMKAMLDRFGFPMLRDDDTPLANPAEIIQRVTDAETGDVLPVEPPGVPVTQQKVQQAKANAKIALVNALLPDKTGSNLSFHQWIEESFSRIAKAKTPTDIANETALSIKSLTQMANSVYPSNRAAAAALETAVVKLLLEP